MNEAYTVKSRQRGWEGKWTALKAMLESWALILLAVASQPGDSEQRGQNQNTVFWKKVPREETDERGRIPGKHSTA